MERLSPEQRLAQWRQRVWRAVHTARTDQTFLAAGLEIDHQHVDGERLTAHGWAAMRGGELAEAETYFRAAIHRDPYTIGAWIGLSRVVDSIEERRACLQTALDLQQLVTELQRGC